MILLDVGAGLCVNFAVPDEVKEKAIEAGQLACNPQYLCAIRENVARGEGESKQ